MTVIKIESYEYVNINFSDYKGGLPPKKVTNRVLGMLRT